MFSEYREPDVFHAYRLRDANEVPPIDVIADRHCSVCQCCLERLEIFFSDDLEAISNPVHRLDEEDSGKPVQEMMEFIMPGIIKIRKGAVEFHICAVILHADDMLPWIVFRIFHVIVGQVNALLDFHLPIAQVVNSLTHLRISFWKRTWTSLWPVLP